MGCSPFEYWSPIGRVEKSELYLVRPRESRLQETKTGYRFGGGGPKGDTGLLPRTLERNNSRSLSFFIGKLFFFFFCLKEIKECSGDPTATKGKSQARSFFH